MPQINTILDKRSHTSQKRAPQKRPTQKYPRTFSKWAIKSLGAALGIGLFFQAGTWLIDRSPTFFENAIYTVGFRVQAIEVEGRVRTPLADLRQATRVSRGDPIFKVALDSIQKRVMQLPWIHDVTVQRTLPGLISIHLVERQPLALWQKNGKKYLLDKEGCIIPCALKDHPASLLTVVGENAPQGTDDLLSLLKTFPELLSRVQAATRFRCGRWDLYLKEKAVLKLPLQNPGVVLQKFLDLEKQNVLQTKTLEIVDLRFHDRLIIQPRALLSGRGQRT